MMEVCYENGVPPPYESVDRIMKHPRFSIIRGKVTLGQYDFMILATGFEIDGRKQPELQSFIEDVLLWGDRMEKNRGPEWFYRSPYLGNHFQFLEKNHGTAPFLKHIYCFNYAATLSHGLLSGDIPGIGVGASRLARGIASDLFKERWVVYYQRLVDYQDPELDENSR